MPLAPCPRHQLPCAMSNVRGDAKPEAGASAKAAGFEGWHLRRSLPLASGGQAHATKDLQAPHAPSLSACRAAACRASRRHGNLNLKSRQWAVGLPKSVAETHLVTFSCFDTASYVVGAQATGGKARQDEQQARGIVPVAGMHTGSRRLRKKGRATRQLAGSGLVHTRMLQIGRRVCRQAPL